MIFAARFHARSTINVLESFHAMGVKMKPGCRRRKLQY